MIDTLIRNVSEIVVRGITRWSTCKGGVPSKEDVAVDSDTIWFRSFGEIENPSDDVVFIVGSRLPFTGRQLASFQNAISHTVNGSQVAAAHLSKTACLPTIPAVSDGWASFASAVRDRRSSKGVRACDIALKLDQTTIVQVPAIRAEILTNAEADLKLDVAVDVSPDVDSF